MPLAVAGYGRARMIAHADRVSGTRILRQPSRENGVKHEVEADAAAKVFDVSRAAATVRLRELGYEAVIRR